MKILRKTNNGNVIRGANGILKYKESIIEYVDYLEGDGAQIIDSGVGSGYALSGLSLLTYIQKTETPDNLDMFIQGSVASGGLFSFWGVRWESSNIKFYYAGGGMTMPEQLSSDYINDKTIFEIINGSMTLGAKTKTGNTRLVMNGNIFLLSDGIGNGCPGRVWETIISYNGSVVADLKPCVKDGVACMHDVVRNIFIYNSGTGDFLYGNDED